MALVPSLLRREWRGRRLPEPLAVTMGAQGACWDDLDATVWEGRPVDPSTAARAVSAAVESVLARRERLRLAPMPLLSRAWPDDLDPGVVPFRTRTRHVISVLTEGPSGVSIDQLTVGVLLATPRSGVGTMLDFACTAEASLDWHEQWGSDGRSAVSIPDPDLVGLAQEAWTSGVAGDDERFGDLLAALWRGSVADLVAMGTRQAKAELRSILPDLRSRLTTLASMPLEEALAGYVEGLIGFASREAQVQVVLARLGLRGEPPTSLQEAGDLVGLTRERVRQLEAKAVERRRASACPVPYLPQLDAALSRLAEALPLAGRDVSSLLVEAGLAIRPFGVESLSAAARFLGRDLPYAVTGPGAEAVLVAYSSAILPTQAAAIRSMARAQAAKSGASNCMELVRELGEEAEGLDYELLALVVRTSDGAVMGDAGWFWFVDGETAASPFTKVSLGMLAVTTPLPIRSLLAGLRRRGAFRRLPVVPPAHVLEQVYATHPSFVVDDDQLVWPAEEVQAEAVLGDLDRRVLEILRAAPRQTLDRGELVRASRMAGLNLASVNRYLTYSPSIEKVGEGSYAPRGATQSAGVVAMKPSTTDRAASTRYSRPIQLQPAGLLRSLTETFPDLPPAVLPYVHLVHTAEAMGELFEQLWTTAQREVLAFSRPPFSFRPGVVLPAVVDALSRGVVARAVYEAPLVDDPRSAGFREEVDAYVEAGVQAKVVDHLPVKLVVFDGQVSLVALAGQTVDIGYPTNLLIDHAGFAEVQAGAFERKWEAARAYVQPASIRSRAPKRARGGASA